MRQQLVVYNIETFSKDLVRYFIMEYDRFWQNDYDQYVLY